MLWTRTKTSQADIDREGECCGFSLPCQPASAPFPPGRTRNCSLKQGLVHRCKWFFQSSVWHETSILVCGGIFPQVFPAFPRPFKNSVYLAQNLTGLQNNGCDTRRHFTKECSKAQSILLECGGNQTPLLALQNQDSCKIAQGNRRKQP